MPVKPGGYGVYRFATLFGKPKILGVGKGKKILGLPTTCIMANLKMGLCGNSKIRQICKENPAPCGPALRAADTRKKAVHSNQKGGDPRPAGPARHDRQES